MVSLSHRQHVIFIKESWQMQLITHIEKNYSDSNKRGSQVFCAFPVSVGKYLCETLKQKGAISISSFAR